MMERRVSTKLSNYSKKSNLLQTSEDVNESESDSEKQLSIMIVI